MTTPLNAWEARADDAVKAFAEYEGTPRWMWFRRGRLLHRAHLLALEYARLRERYFDELRD